MKRSEYLQRLQAAYDAGRIDNEAYDAAYSNLSAFCDDEEEYVSVSSASAGDYSPSCPWNAPGMSVRDFL